MARDLIVIWSEIKQALAAKNGRYSTPYAGNYWPRMTPEDADRIRAFWFDLINQIAKRALFELGDDWSKRQLERAMGLYQSKDAMLATLIGMASPRCKFSLWNPTSSPTMAIGTFPFRVEVSRWACLFPDDEYVPEQPAAELIRATDALVPALSTYGDWAIANIKSGWALMKESLAEAASELGNKLGRYVPSLPNPTPWVQLLKWGTLAGLGGYIAYLLYKDSQKR